MTIVNLTPHDATIGGIRYARSGQIARVAETSTQVGEADGTPVLLVQPGQVTGLPAPVPGTLLLVSRMVADALPDRTDLIFPFRIIRDLEGTITGAEAFGTVHRQK